MYASYETLMQMELDSTKIPYHIRNFMLLAIKRYPQKISRKSNAFYSYHTPTKQCPKDAKI